MTEQQQQQQHRATASEWACVKVRTSSVAVYSCLFELLHRIEALEAAADRAASEAFRAASTEPRPSEVAARIRAAADARAKSNHREIPDSSLVKRVAEAMQPGTFDWSAYEGEARAAIRAVTAWMRKESSVHFEVDEVELGKVGLYWAQELEQEAKR